MAKLECPACHYSGKASAKFWELVNSLSPDDSDKDWEQDIVADALYSLGVDLQVKEHEVLTLLQKALKKYGKKGRPQ